MKISESGAAFPRCSRRAKSNPARGLKTNSARLPPDLAGESKNTLFTPLLYHFHGFLRGVEVDPMTQITGLALRQPVSPCRVRSVGRKGCWPRPALPVRMLFRSRPVGFAS